VNLEPKQLRSVLWKNGDGEIFLGWKEIRLAIFYKGY